MGDLIWDAGTVRDVHSLQHRGERNGHALLLDSHSADAVDAAATAVELGLVRRFDAISAPPGCRLDEHSMDVILEPRCLTHCHFIVRLEKSAMPCRCVVPFCIWIGERCVGSMAQDVINLTS